MKYFHPTSSTNFLGEIPLWLGTTYIWSCLGIFQHIFFSSENAHLSKLSGVTVLMVQEGFPGQNQKERERERESLE